MYYGGTYCYYPPGVLHVLLLGEFPKYADPNRLDLGGQIWLQERGGQQCSRIPKRGQIGEIILSQYKLNVNCCDDVAGHKTKFFDSPLKDLDISRILSTRDTH